MRKRKEKVVRRKCCVDCAELEDEEQVDDPYLTATGKPFVINKEGQEKFRKFYQNMNHLRLAIMDPESTESRLY